MKVSWGESNSYHLRIYTYSSEKETIVEIGFGIAIENSKIDIFFPRYIFKIVYVFSYNDDKIFGHIF